MPPVYAQYAHMWATLNPGWQIYEWGIEDLGAFPETIRVINHLALRDEGRNSIELFVQMADVLGYAIVERFGGVYVNCDIQPLRPLEELPIPDTAWASYENHEDGRVVNAVIGAPEPHDPFWQRIMDGITDRYFANPYDEMVMTTGPGYLTDVALAHPEEIHVFPVETFNPVHWKEIAPGGDASGFTYPPESFGVHHWGHRRDHRTNRIEGATL